MLVWRCAARTRYCAGYGRSARRRTGSWADARLDVRYEWRLAHRTDLQAVLSRHEETLRAMDGMATSAPASVPASQDPNELSFKRISEDTSPVVKLVHSTLYDA